MLRVVTRSCYKTGMAPRRVLIHISRYEHRVLDPDDMYYLQARGGETEGLLDEIIGGRRP